MITRIRKNDVEMAKEKLRDEPHYWPEIDLIKFAAALSNGMLCVEHDQEPDNGTGGKSVQLKDKQK